MAAIRAVVAQSSEMSPHDGLKERFFMIPATKYRASVVRYCMLAFRFGFCLSNARFVQRYSRPTAAELKAVRTLA